MPENSTTEQPRFRIFRFGDSVDLQETDVMSYKPLTDVQQQGVRALVDAGYGAGAESRVLVDLPGFSLVQVWFKSDFPLPLHSHDQDCLYHVVAGSLHLGHETLAAGDSFFIAAGVPYTYRPGPQGVEVLEIRHANAFDFVNHARDEAFYRRAVEAVADNLANWAGQGRPSGIA